MFDKLNEFKTNLINCDTFVNTGWNKWYNVRA